MRKDFIIDEIQILESKAFGADCILLIASILDKNKIKDFYQIAKENELDVVLSGKIHPDLGGTAKIETQKKLVELTEKEKQIRLQIKDILAQGMQSAIEGLISGTKTLGQSFLESDAYKSFRDTGIKNIKSELKWDPRVETKTTVTETTWPPGVVRSPRNEESAQ